MHGNWRWVRGPDGVIEGLAARYLFEEATINLYGHETITWRMDEMRKDGTGVGWWLAEPDLGRIRCGKAEVYLRPQLMQVLLLLAEHRGRLVSASLLIERVWGRRWVSSSVVARGNAQGGFGQPLGIFRDLLALLTGDVESRSAVRDLDSEQTDRLWRDSH